MTPEKELPGFRQPTSNGRTQQQLSENRKYGHGNADFGSLLISQ